MNCLIRLCGTIFLSGAATLAQPQVPSLRPPAKSIAIPSSASLPQWPALKPFQPELDSPAIRSGDMEIIHAKSPLAGFLVRVAGQTVAVGISPSVIGYVYQDQVRWLDCAKSSLRKQSVLTERNTIRSSFECPDADGATWYVTQRFRPQRVPGIVEVQTDVSVDQDRAVALLPMLLIFPGVGSFGAAKGQGLFAGLEYLENEPSSSEADVIGSAARRQVPDSLKITFPLMAIQAQGRYVGLSWQMRPHFSALFDSPDRLFHSGGHAMGLLFPGSHGRDRVDGNLLPPGAEVLHANETLTLRATLLAGSGNSLVPALQHYVRWRPLPAPPAALVLTDYVARATGGWLNSTIHEGNLVRHALAAGAFKAQPAADAALWTKWLAAHEPDTSAAARLEQSASNFLSAVSPADYNVAGVGHVRYPVESLLFGHVAENAEQARLRGRELLARFEPDGSVKYRPQAGAVDLGKTHYTNEACGYSSRVVLDLLEAAAFCGDPDLIVTGLRRVRGLDKFHDGVPRGAQTWECPLHTPDILASAQMVHAYTLGYELSGDPHFLEEARYWAWTGVPFTYLVNPTEAPVGLYSTIAVYGATQWKAPVWFGLPVQWCGLVYADSLYRLARFDSKGPWKQLADGITISGMQQCWTTDDPDFQGLLPDSFVLREQKRNGPAINPATVEACAAHYFDAVPVYDFHCFRSLDLKVHAPGEIQNPAESKGHVSFQVASWTTTPFFVLVNGFKRKPQLKINGQNVACVAPHEFFPDTGRLVLKLQGHASVDLSF